mmetsp:Transcript_13893/g.34200  ORF Transcript_13893/g.34200 Transcript_13893/m.34200 type:complete len:631 (-) Transcript_13893:129-2021(-)
MDAEQGVVSQSIWDPLNQKVAKSWIGRYFEVNQRKSSFTTEFRAGTVTFLTMAYILAVEAGMLRDTGGPCTVDDCMFNKGQPFCMFGEPGKGFDPGYTACLEEVKRSFISATAISSLVACFLMGVMANMPLALAPGMGVNAFFTYTAVGFFGSGGMISYKQAVAAAFIEGWLFLFIAIMGIRGHVIRLVPRAVMLATSGGIGLFLAFIGLQAAEGIALITADPATLVTLGGCDLVERAYSYSPYPPDLNYDAVCGGGADAWANGPPQALGPRSANYSCMGGQLRSATTWLGILGGMLMVLLMMKNTKASILVGILFITFISWIPDHKASYLGASSPIPFGEERREYFLKGAVVPSVKKTGGQLDFKALNQGDVWVALITFLYLDFLDATSTMFAMARIVAESVPGFVNEKGQWPRQLWTMVVDGIAIVIGSLLGTSPLTVFAESAVGIREGGRTGITAFIVACGFGVSMFLSPIFASIPPYATGPAIVLVGCLMMEHSRYVHWDDIRQAIPAFLTIVLMPLTYSIAYGIICGITSAIFLWLWDMVWEMLLVLCGYYKGEKTLYHVWLDGMSNFYCAFNQEHILVRDLPGYKAVTVLPFEADSHQLPKSQTMKVATGVQKEVDDEVPANKL